MYKTYEDFEDINGYLRAIRRGRGLEKYNRISRQNCGDHHWNDDNKNNISTIAYAKIFDV